MTKKSFAFAALSLLMTVLACDAFAGAQSFIDKTDVGGSVDLSYTFNLNRPPRVDTNGNGRGDTSLNMLRIFDTEANGFTFNHADFYMTHHASDWASFRFDLGFGNDPRVYQAFGFNDGDNFDIQQAYVVLTAPVGNGLDFKIGKFVTPFGMEVIESAENNNFSRSLLFGYTIPFTHTGVIASYEFNEWISASLGLLNGWDNVVDNNSGKTGVATITVKPGTEKVSLFLGGAFGPEQDDSDGNFRTLLDAIVTWHALENLTFTGNFDLGKEQGIGGTGFANWWGFAGYAHWRATDLFGLTLRGEYFGEDTPAGVGVRTGTNASKVTEGTITSHFYVLPGLDLRAEFRHDIAANSIFVKSSGATSKSQSTIAFETVYAF